MVQFFVRATYGTVRLVVSCGAARREHAVLAVLAWRVK